MTTLFEQTPAAPAIVPAAGARPTVLGLDLSLTSSGVCLPDGTTYCIKTRAKDGDQRLLQIRNNIRAALRAQPPTLAVIEDLPRSAMGAGITAMVQGVVRTELAEAEVPYALIAPATLKCFACDNGKAEKTEMADAAYLVAGAEFPGDLNANGEGGDMCDAWWLRASGLEWLGIPEFDLPAAQRDRLAKAKWPPREQVVA